MSGLASILLVDDEPGFARTLAMRLRLRGFECVVAGDGITALDMHEGGAFSHVLLDLRLPDVPGADVLRVLKERDPDLPVVIITAHGTDIDEKACMALGASAFMSKPVDIDEIVSQLMKSREKT